MTAPVLVRADFLGRTALVTAAFGAKLARVAEAVRAAYTTAMLDLPAGSPKPTFAEWQIASRGRDGASPPSASAAPTHLPSDSTRPAAHAPGPCCCS